jgi:hypothetical protein
MKKEDLRVKVKEEQRLLESFVASLRTKENIPHVSNAIIRLKEAFFWIDEALDKITAEEVFVESEDNKEQNNGEQ